MEEKKRIREKERGRQRRPSEAWQNKSKVVLARLIERTMAEAEDAPLRDRLEAIRVIAPYLLPKMPAAVDLNVSGSLGFEAADKLFESVFGGVTQAPPAIPEGMASGPEADEDLESREAERQVDGSGG